MSELHQPTGEMVGSFWRYLCARYGSTVVLKEDALVARAVGQALELAGIMDARAFLGDYVTTLGKIIYCPFVPGSPHPQWSLWDQMVACVHEHQHVEQYNAEGAAFGVRYLFSRAERARFEAEAYVCNVEMEHWRTGRLIPPGELAGRLIAYGCSEEDVTVARQSIDLMQETIKRGGIVTAAMRKALDWMNVNALHLRSVA